MELQLKQGDILFGILRPYTTDFPWMICKFQPTEAFAEVEPLFREELKILNADVFDVEAWENAYKHIDVLGLKLVELDNAKEITEFILHIQNDEAWCRY